LYKPRPVSVQVAAVARVPFLAGAGLSEVLRCEHVISEQEL
jgi:hypothetical protein